MISALTDAEAWVESRPADRWVFDRLEFCLRMGHAAGPAGIPVSRKGIYITRPLVNLEGLGQGAELRALSPDDSHIPAGHFWCELFSGRRLGVDYANGKPVLAVEKFYGPQGPYGAWSRKVRTGTKDVPGLPRPLWGLCIRHRVIGVSFVGDKAVGAHLRPDPDFCGRSGVEELIPVWDGAQERPDGFRYADDRARSGGRERLGFFYR